MNGEKKKAILVGVYLKKTTKDREACHEHLDELARLAETFGVDPVEAMACGVEKFDGSTLMGSGKVAELNERATQQGVDLVIFDDEMSPAQQRNLEKILGRTVMDRTELILGVFAHRAHTKEARIQVELAEARYELPRLRRLWTHLERQVGAAGGGKYLKGMGEKQLEVDRRLLSHRIQTLKHDLKEVETHRRTQRHARERAHLPVFAIVGYTNAGKSTLLNALTAAGVFVEDKLFATLDTATRKFSLPNKEDVLLVDTVGFIRKLPHMLVAAFKSTLEEACYADVLIHVIDVTHPQADEHAAVAVEVLKELHAADKPTITVLNKIDLAEHPAKIQRFRFKYPKTVLVSALTGEGLEDLCEKMTQELKARRALVTLRVPQCDYAVVSRLMLHGTILEQEYVENDILLTCEVPKDILAKLQPYIQ